MIGKLLTSEQKEEGEFVNNDLQVTEAATEKSLSSSPQEKLLSFQEEPKSASAVERHGQSRGKKKAPAPASTTSPKPAPPRLTPEQRLVKLMEKHPLHWGVKDVGDWLEAFGYAGYRTQFIHHAISGAVFPLITDKVLKEELGIKNLGHREALTRAIADLLKSSPLEAGAAAITPAAAAAQLSPSLCISLSPSRNALSAMVAGGLPGVEILRAKEQHQRLTRDLDKAKARVESRKAAAAQAARTAETRKTEAEQAARAADAAVKEVLQLQAALKEAERHMAGRNAEKSGSAKGTAEAASERTFQERLEADLKARKAKRGAEKAPRKPGTSTDHGALAISLEYLQTVLQETDPDSSLVDQPRESLPAALDEAAMRLSAAIDLSPKDVEAVKAAPSAAKKASLLATAARTALFMQRLNMDLTVRTLREKEATDKVKAARAAAMRAAEDRDLEDARKKFTELGWPAESLMDPEQLARSMEELVSKAKAMKGSKGAGGAANSQPGAATALVELLAAARADELEKVEAAKDARAKLLAIFRTIRAQEFLKTTENKRQEKAAKIAEAAAAGRPAKKVQGKEAGEAFLQRLAEDVDRRAKNREELAAKVLAEEKAKSESQKNTVGKGGK